MQRTWYCTQSFMRSLQNLYSLLACLTLVLFKPLNPGSPSGYRAERRGGGGPRLSLPLGPLIGIFLAFDEVPHGGASMTPFTRPLLISSKTNFCEDGSVRSSFTAGPFIRRLSMTWSTPKASAPYLFKAAATPAVPQKMSKK